MPGLIPFTKTLTLQDATEPAAPAGRMMMRAAVSEPPTIWQLQARAVADLVTEMRTAGIPADESWIRTTRHASGSTENTIKALGLLPTGSPARFEGGPLDGTSRPCELEPSAGQMPRLECSGGAYELAPIDYAECEYAFSWVPAEPAWKAG